MSNKMSSKYIINQNLMSNKCPQNIYINMCARGADYHMALQ